MNYPYSGCSGFRSVSETFLRSSSVKDFAFSSRDDTPEDTAASRELVLSAKYAEIALSYLASISRVCSLVLRASETVKNATARSTDSSRTQDTHRSATNF